MHFSHIFTADLFPGFKYINWHIPLLVPGLAAFFDSVLGEAPLIGRLRYSISHYENLGNITIYFIV